MVRMSSSGMRGASSRSRLKQYRQRRLQALVRYTSRAIGQYPNLAATGPREMLHVNRSRPELLFSYRQARDYCSFSTSSYLALPGPTFLGSSSSLTTEGKLVPLLWVFCAVSWMALCRCSSFP